MDETVNFWDYATNEYCLDSFICYLLRFEKAKKAFFKLSGIDENEKIQDNGIRQQNKNVDVLIETSNSFLIIEDKVDSSEHDNQLKKYIEAVDKENKNKKIHICYVKSGFLSEQEKRDIREEVKKVEIKDEDKIIKTLYFSEEEKNLCFINLSDLSKIADCIEENEIIKQWIEKYTDVLNEQDKIFEEIKKYINNDNYEALYDKVFNDKENENKKGYLYPYLDILTEKIRKETSYKEANWFLAGYGTAHIELKDKEEAKRKYIPDKCWTSYSCYVMFRKKRPQLVFKQHFFEKEREGNRIGTDKYSSIGLDKVLLTSKRNLGELSKDWKKVSEENKKDKLMLCKKFLNINDDLVEVLKKEKENINKIFGLFERQPNDGKRT